MFRSTTVLSVRRDGRVAIGVDGQVTIRDIVVKSDARKIRRLYHDKVLVGFAGAAADAFSKRTARIADLSVSIRRSKMTECICKLRSKLLKKR